MQRLGEVTGGTSWGIPSSRWFSGIIYVVNVVCWFFVETVDMLHVMLTLDITIFRYLVRFC